MWRLVGVLSGTDGEVAQRAVRPRAVALIARLISLVRRFVLQDAPDETLFERVVETARFVTRENLHEDELSLVEAIALARVLFILGYLDAGQPGLAAAAGSGWERDELARLAPERGTVVLAVNEALAAVS
jgi:hypothetical protein